MTPEQFYKKYTNEELSMDEIKAKAITYCENNNIDFGEVSKYLLAISDFINKGGNDGKH